MEVWKDIPGYEGLYQVSTWGNVRSLIRVTKKRIYIGKVLKQQTAKNGYKRLTLYKDGKERTVTVHRLVALTFIPNPGNLPTINHKDECKANNNVFNLEWASVGYNNTYGSRKDSKKGEKNYFYGKHFTGKDNYASRKTAQYDLEGNLLKVYDCVADAGRDNNVSVKAIYTALRRRDKENRSGLSGGFIWAYAD